MARSRNPTRTSYLKLSTTEQVVERLDKLVAGGLWGKTRSEVAESLVRESLRQLELPFTQRKGPKRSPAKASVARKRVS
jgi:hypothetical protein